MSFDFVTDDYWDGTITALDSGDWTLGGWIAADTGGENNFGVVLNAHAGAASRQFCSAASLTNLQGYQDQATGDASAVTNTGSVVAGTYCCAFWQYVESTARVDIFFGSPAAAVTQMGLSVDIPGAGARTTGGVTATIGSETTAGGNAFDGRLTEVFLTARALSLGEMERFRLGRRTFLFDDSLRLYVPLWTNAAQELSGRASGITAVGPTLHASNPPVLPRAA